MTRDVLGGSEITVTTEPAQERPVPGRPGGPSVLGLRFRRSAHDALLTGVAGGLGERWGVDPMLVRIAFVLLSFAGAVGAFAYLAAWAVALEPDRSEGLTRRESSTQQNVAFGCIVLGAVLLLREAGFWFGDAVGIPLLVAAVGAAVIYVRGDEQRRSRWAQLGGARPSMELRVERPSLGRVVVGGLLVVGGIGSFLAATDALAAIGSVLLAVGATAAGLALVFGPWVLRLVNQLAAERRNRIRSEERAEMAAHLHDSVLQTLALIQRNAANPRKMVSLARRQERELRTWLYGRPAGAGADRLQAALEAMAQDIEQAHDVAVEVVVVGDCALDERVAALVDACREAATNAALHSGAGEVSVYVECEAREAVAYVRDRGRGFALEEVPADRRGIADSIRGRIERHGGKAKVTSAPGEGTEVEIRVPREAT